MKHLEKIKRQLVGAALMLSLSVPLVLVAIALPTLPTLDFRISGLEMREDGSAQLFFDVSLLSVEKYQDALSNGARFELNYNADYMTPSNYKTNAALRDGEQGAKPNSEEAFHYNQELYQEYVDDGNGGKKLESRDPFTKRGTDVNYIDTTNKVLSLHLVTDQSIDVTKGVGLKIAVTSETGVEGYRMFDRKGEITLGTLSFRIEPENLDKLPEMVKKFGGIQEETDPKAKDGSGEYLLWYSRKPESGPNSGPWAIEVCAPVKDSAQYTHSYLDNYSRDSIWPARAQSWFTFAFPRTMISARAAEMELTVDAYQAYSNGNVGDLFTTLQKYSPTVIATYTDGSQDSFMLPWGNALGTPWESGTVYDRDTVTLSSTGAVISGTKVVDGTPGTGEKAYDPTGWRYQVEKDFYYEETDPNDSTVKIQKKFPIPIGVKLTVTPITLVDVTTDDLHRSYILNDALVEENGALAIQNVNDLDLPEEARLITDVPAGGSTLTMAVPGWSHLQGNGRWPLDDGTSDAAGKAMGELWKDGATAGNNPDTGSDYHHWPTVDDTGKWATGEINGELLGRNRAGRYTFVMAQSYGGIATDFQKTDIQRAFPWLTVPNDSYPLENATRGLVWNGDPGDGGSKPDKLEDVDNYKVEYLSTEVEPAGGRGEGQPVLTLRVTKVVNQALNSLNDGSVFRVKMPDGTEIQVGNVNGYHPTEDWFADAGYHNQTARTNLGDTQDRRGYDLITNPGDPTTGSSATERERLRRYINLGGWFSVAVKEGPDADGTQYVWSDFIPVYVPPRTNYYTEDKVYNFIGANAGLYPWPGGLGSTVYLPAGDYEVVDDNGNPKYVTDGTITEQLVERYGVATTYDGITGAQPGELNQFTIYNDWRRSTGILNGVTTFGANEFLDNAPYNAFGRVHNLTLPQEAAGNHTATVRTEKDTSAETQERITLHYVSTSGGSSSVDYRANGNVNRVIYDTRMEGYTTRQEYTLVITNEGDTDIYGLDIDTLTDEDRDGGHYELLKPPASFLPAHTSTTFTLAYVYGLEARDNVYLDKLYITSNSKKDVGPGKKEGTDYLLDFYAQFQVTEEEIHRVTVVVDPADETLGTAHVIMGVVQQSSGHYAMSTESRSNAFSEGNWVYVGAFPKDEYDRLSVTAVDAAGNNITIYPYTGGDGSGSTDENAAVPADTYVYRFRMPNYDTTVTVKFYEPITSKLRLSAMTTYAAEKDDLLKPVENNQVEGKYEYKVWQKRFTKAEEDEAAAKGTVDNGNLYLMTAGTADKKDFDSSVDQYIVVIPYEATRAQVEVTLRQVAYSLGGTNKDLENVSVEMLLYHTKEDVLNYRTPDTVCHDTNGKTATPTTHLTNYVLPGNIQQYAFDSPDPGLSKYVHIRIGGHEEGETVDTYRSYYLEIHRAPREAIATLGYGNSPYGMIMNDASISAADKQTAKAAFTDNRYSFNGLAHVPAVVKGTALEKLHYWSEAWVAPDAAYEPESLMGYEYDSVHEVWVPKADIYQTANNLDLNDYAFFAILGSEFEDPGVVRALDSSGREVDLSKVTISLEAYTLDTSAATQAERFALPDDPNDKTARMVTLSLGAASIPGTVRTVPADWGSPTSAQLDGKYLRPGRYRLQYTYPDYDASEPGSQELTVSRDLVILSPVGDVDADVQIVRKDGDEKLTKGRVRDPLGYTAANYEWAGIFKHRCCDVNNDRNINNIDANNIRANNGVKQYYLPVGYK